MTFQKSAALSSVAAALIVQVVYSFPLFAVFCCAPRSMTPGAAQTRSCLPSINEGKRARPLRRLAGGVTLDRHDDDSWSAAALLQNLSRKLACKGRADPRSRVWPRGKICEIRFACVIGRGWRYVGLESSCWRC